MTGFRSLFENLSVDEMRAIAERLGYTFAERVEDKMRVVEMRRPDGTLAMTARRPVES